jgi:hypothetical protein
MNSGGAQGGAIFGGLLRDVQLQGASFGAVGFCGLRGESTFKLTGQPGMQYAVGGPLAKIFQELGLTGAQIADGLKEVSQGGDQYAQVSKESLMGLTPNAPGGGMSSSVMEV